MPKTTELIHVDGPVVTCDGGCGILGHPLVYLRVGRLGYVDCPYCGRHFIQSKTASSERTGKLVG